MGCDIIPNHRHDLPVLGSFSAARLILPYLKKLSSGVKRYMMLLRGNETSSVTVYENLVKLIAHVYRDLMQTGLINSAAHPQEYNLFHNPHHSVDGNCYAL